MLDASFAISQVCAKSHDDRLIDPDDVLLEDSFEIDRASRTSAPSRYVFIDVRDHVVIVRSSSLLHDDDRAHSPADHPVLPRSGVAHSQLRVESVRAGSLGSI